MKDILFVNICDYIKKQGFEPPIGLISLSETLNNIGMESEIMDFQYMYTRGEFQLPRNMNEYISNMCSCILAKGIRLISFYTMCSNLHIVVRVAEVLKKQDPSLLIGLGGPQATVTADAIMKRYNWIDFVGLGEGETSIQSIVNIMHSEKNREEGIAVKGLVYRNKHGIVNGGLPELIENLDELPILRYKGFDISGLDSLSLDVGRGCPFSCTFCSTKSFWKRRYRIKSSSRLVFEMEYYNNNYKIQQFSLQHDMLTADKDAVLELCNLLKQKKLNITWVCSARIDMLDEVLVKEMISAGCVGVFIGIESGSQEIQRKINKNLDLHQATENIIRFSNMGLNMALSFIYGFPEETEKNIEETLRYIYSLVQYAPAVKKRLQLHRLSFFAGTELTTQNFHMLEYDKILNHTMSYSNDRIYSAEELPKEIFPHFYKLKTEHIYEYGDLDNFVMLILLKTLKGYEGTYKTLVGSQGFSFIELYRKYARYEKESGFYKKVGFYNVADMDDKAVLEEFYCFVKSVWNDTLIAAVAEIEHEINQYMYSENCDERLLWSTVDYLSAKKYGCAKTEKDSVILLNKEDERVKIRQMDPLKIEKNFNAHFVGVKKIGIDFFIMTKGEMAYRISNVQAERLNSYYNDPVLKRKENQELYMLMYKILNWVNQYDTKESRRKSLRYMVKQYPDYPMMVSMQITSRCNLRCEHCYNVAGTKDKNISFKEAVKVIDWMREKGIVHLSITGGEAILYRGLWNIVRYACKNKLQVTINTNGYAVTGKMIESLKQRGSG